MKDKKELHLSPGTHQIVTLEMAEGEPIELIVKKEDRDRFLNLLKKHFGHMKPS